MTSDQIEKIRNEYTVDGKLDVGPDDPRFHAALMNMARDRDLAERGVADVLAGGQGRDADELRDASDTIGLCLIGAVLMLVGGLAGWIVARM